MRGPMPNTVARRNDTPPFSSTAFSAAILVVPYSEIGFSGVSSVHH